MTTRNSDVNLVIKARTEGEKLIEQLANTLADLYGEAHNSSTGLKELGKSVADLDRAYATINTKADGASSAFDRQTKRIAETRAELEALKNQAAAAARVLENLSSAEAVVNAGRDQGNRIEQIKLVSAEQQTLESRIAKVSRALEQQNQASENSRSSLQRLGSTVIAVEEAQGIAAGRIAAATAEIERQVVAADRLTEAQQRGAEVLRNVERSTGVSAPSATSGGATFEQLIAQFQRLDAEAQRVRQSIDPVADAIERAEKKIAAVQRLAREGYLSNDEAVIRERQLQRELDQTIEKIAAAATAERNRIKGAQTEIQALINSTQGVTGSRAVDVGATFEALDADQKKREAAVRAREAAELQATIGRNTGIDRVPATASRAQGGGATFSALAAREADAEAAELRAAKVAYEAFETAARNGAKALREAELAELADGAAVTKLRAALEPAAAIQHRFNEQLALYQGLVAKGKLSTEELARAEVLLRKDADEATAALARQGNQVRGAQGGSNKISLFGLKPYELQNLGYQVNDVVTQLASGTSLSQTLAQQGGQILQLFPRVTGAIVSLATNPAFLTSVAVVGGIALALKEAGDQAERLRHYTADLNFRADGSEYNAGALSKQERAFEHLGATSEEARKAVAAFLDAGVAPDKLKVFGDTAQNLADVMGTKLPDAAKLLADSLTQGYEAVAALDEKYHFLTATQREHIRTLFDEGKASEARTEALGILARKSEEFANNQRGPWAGATRELNAAWKEFLDTIGDSETFKIAGTAVGKLAEAAKNAAADIRGASDASAAAIVLASRRDALSKLEKYNEEITKRDGQQSKALAAELKAARAAVREAEDNLRKLGGDPTGGVGGKGSAARVAPGGDTRTNDPNSAAAKKAADAVKRISDEDALQRLRDAGSTRILSKQERARREELAGIIAARDATDSTVAAAEKRRAIAHEVATIEKETDARAKEAAREREQAIKQFEQRVIGAEGGPGKNPYSTAKGYGQFTESSYIGYYRKTELDQSKSRDEILATRNNRAIAGAVIDAEARDLAKHLQALGKTINAGNLYLLHFLGQGTGSAVLRASSDTPVDEIIRRVDPNAGKVLSGNQGYLRTEKGKGRYRTAGELQTFIAGRVGDVGAPQSQGVAEEIRLAQSSEDHQKSLNQALKDEADARQLNIDALTTENGLRDHALLAAQRAAAIARAELGVRKRVEDQNKNLKDGETPVSVSDEQIAKAKELAAAEFDIAHARASAEADVAGPSRRVDEYREEVSLLRQEYEFLLSIGDMQSAAAVDAKIRDVNKSLASAIDDLVATYEKLTPQQLKTLNITDKGLKNIIATLRQGKQATQEFGKIAGVSSQEIARAFGGAAANALTNFISKVSSGKNVFKSLGESVLEFAANFASAVAQMILQLLAYAAAVAILRALGVPVPGGGLFGGGGAGPSPSLTASAGTTISSNPGIFHAGGVIGTSAPTRPASADLFRNAMRFHTGGVVGIGPDEVPIIAKRNEEMLTRDDPRHRANGGMAGSPNIHIVNATDPEHAAEIMLRTKAGERAILNLVSNNPRAFKAALQS